MHGCGVGATDPLGCGWKNVKKVGKISQIAWSHCDCSLCLFVLFPWFSCIACVDNNLRQCLAFVVLIVCDACAECTGVAESGVHGLLTWWRDLSGTCKRGWRNALIMNLNRSHLFRRRHVGVLSVCSAHANITFNVIAGTANCKTLPSPFPRLWGSTCFYLSWQPLLSRQPLESTAWSATVLHIHILNHM